MSGKWKLEPLHRWDGILEHTLPYRIFKKYDCDLMNLITTFESSKAYVYTSVARAGAKWDSRALDFNLSEGNADLTIREWSKNIEEFANWMRLSLLMSCTSYFETYIASVIKESIQSNPGILIGASHSIDGIALLKQDKKLPSELVERHLLNVTKGTWQSRVEGLKNLLGPIPEILETSIPTLERMRTLRNNFAHAFGRDIQASQDYQEVTKIAIDRLSIKRFNKYHTLIVDSVRELDTYITQNHLGYYEPLLFYHTIYPSIKDLAKGEKVNEYKRRLLLEKNTGLGKEQIRKISLYYDSL